MAPSTLSDRDSSSSPSPSPSPPLWPPHSFLPPSSAPYSCPPPSDPPLISSAHLVNFASPLPTSVRGAPETLKPAIRKKQNKESARRSRHRRKELVATLSGSLDLLLDRTTNIEKRLANLEVFLAKAGFPPPDLPLPFTPMPAIFGNEEEQRVETDQGKKDHGAGATALEPEGDRAVLEDDEVQRLIEKCMGQL